MFKSHFYVRQGVSILFFLIVISIAVYSFLKPYYSYDLIPYTASTLSLDITNPEKIHDETYKIIRDSVPNSSYEMLTSGEFGERMLNDSTSFIQSLNFYKVKPLYIYLTFVLYKMGLNIVNAIYLISIVSFLGISTLLFLFVRKLNSNIIGTIILSILMLCQPFILIASRNTPDSISAFIIILALYLMLNLKSKLLSGILWALSITVRPDNAIIVVILMAYFGLLSPKVYRLKFIHMVGLVISSFVVYFAINYFEHSYGWSTLFTVSFIHFIERPAETAAHVGIYEYLNVLVTNGIKILTTHILYIFLVGLFGLLVSKKNLLNPIYNHLIKITLGTMILFFLIFPSTEVDRYFISEYLIIFICTLNIIGNSLVHSNQIEIFDSERKAIS